ncbi:MAG TPA: hypothetical protein GXX34_03825 [Clostridia bacterium]|nr:hypothetical protein [Clostridia bacterium]
MALLLLNKSLLEKLSWLVLGMLIGSSCITLLTGKEIDRLTILNREQAEQIRDLERELAQVKESLSRHQPAVISSLDVKITFTEPKPARPEEDAIRLSLEKQIKELFEHLMGMKLEELEPGLVPFIVENRILEAEGRHYRIKVRLLVLAEKIYLEVEAAQLATQI